MREIRIGLQSRSPRTPLLAVIVLMTCAGSTLPDETADREARVEAPKVAARVDPRIELVSIIFRLAGHPEYNQGRIESYTKDVDRHFGPFRDRDAVLMARRLRRSHGISYDACMSLAIHLADNGETFTERMPFDPRPESLEARWTDRDARVFAELVQEFAEASGFRAFFKKHADLYEHAESRLQTLLDEQAHLEWYPAFFGDRPGSRFTLVIGLLNGPMNYGPRCRLDDGAEELYCILGTWQTDAEGLPVFDSFVLETVIHEFCHSYANPVIDRHFEALEAPAKALFEPVADRMKRQAYANPRTMLYESLVRACVIRYLARHSGVLSATRRTIEDQMRGFRWVGGLAHLLAEYERNREDYPTFDDFAPRIVQFFEEQADSAEIDKTAGCP